MDVCIIDWSALGGILGAIATFGGTVVALYIFKQWRNQKSSEVISKFAQELIIKDMELHEYVLEIKSKELEDLKYKLLNYSNNIKLFIKLIDNNDNISFLNEVYDNYRDNLFKYLRNENFNENEFRKKYKEVFTKYKDEDKDKEVNKYHLLLISYIKYKK
jgi:hypothetical protein